LAARLLDDLRELTRNRAEKAVAGTEDRPYRRPYAPRI